MKVSKIALLRDSRDLPGFKQTVKLYLQLRLVHMQKYNETSVLKFIRIQYSYWGIRLLFLTEIPTMEAEKIHIHTVVAKLPYESSVAVTLCWFKHCP